MLRAEVALGNSNGAVSYQRRLVGGYHRELMSETCAQRKVLDRRTCAVPCWRAVDTPIMSTTNTRWLMLLAGETIGCAPPPPPHARGANQGVRVPREWLAGRGGRWQGAHLIKHDAEVRELQDMTDRIARVEKVAPQRVAGLFSKLPHPGPRQDPRQKRPLRLQRARTGLPSSVADATPGERTPPCEPSAVVSSSRSSDRRSAHWKASLVRVSGCRDTPSPRSTGRLGQILANAAEKK